MNKYGQPESVGDYIIMKYAKEFYKEGIYPGAKLPLYDKDGNVSGWVMSSGTAAKEFDETTAKMWQSDYAKEKNLREMREYTDRIERERNYSSSSSSSSSS